MFCTEFDPWYGTFHVFTLHYSPSEKLYLFLDRILADRILTLLIENLGEEKCK